MEALRTLADPFAEAAEAAAREIAGREHFREHHRRLAGLVRYLTRCGDVLAGTLEELVLRLAPEDAPGAARLSALLVDVLLAEEGFSRAYWRAFGRHLRLLRDAGRAGECEGCLRQTLELASALG
ncbi:MAG: hypothetical protein IBX62_03315 [Coriobacteriia bacterium]|nr:hypothetical protein [Coriobacteriia bacterium]